MLQIGGCKCKTCRETCTTSASHAIDVIKCSCCLTVSAGHAFAPGTASSVYLSLTYDACKLLTTVQKPLQMPKCLSPLHLSNEVHSIRYLNTLAAEMLNIVCMLCAGMGQCVGGGNHL